MNAKNEILTQKTQEKKELVERIARMKKDLLQTQKHVKSVNNNNHQLQVDIHKLSSLVNTKGTKNVQQNKEILSLRKETR